MGTQLGLVCEERTRRHAGYEAELERAFRLIAQTRYQGNTLEEWLRRPEISWEKVEEFVPAVKAEGFSSRCIRQIEIETQYAGYIRRQEAEIARMEKIDSIRIPDTFDFAGLTQLRIEAREKLGRLRPTDVGQASRVSGITPSDITVLVMYLKVM